MGMQVNTQTDPMNSCVWEINTLNSKYYLVCFYDKLWAFS